MPSHGIPRAAEVAISLAVLVAASPVLAVVAALVAASSRGPVLFRHRRAGRFGRPFEMLKFRTMRTAMPGADVTTKGDPRITAVGRLLRKTKLDELPELWNVVRGDMSLVGPRPEATRYVALSSPEWQQVLSVRPGVTDPMTLRLRNEEELLAAAGAGYETFYRRYLLPYKLLGYQQYMAGRTWQRDMAVLALTLLVVAIPRSRPAPTPEEIVRAVRQARAAPVMDNRVHREGV